MQGIYDYIPATNHVSRVYSVAAVLYLQFMLHVSSPVKCVLYFYISTCCSMCAVPNMAVFFSSLISCFPIMLLRYCLSGFEMVPVAPVITGITFAVTFHMRYYYEIFVFIFSAFFLIAFLSSGIAASINIHIPCLLSWIMMSDLLLGIVLSVRTCWFNKMVTLP